MPYLRYLCLFEYSGVQHTLCCVFIAIVYHMLPVSLDCPFLITPSVFSNVYIYIWFVDNGLNDVTTPCTIKEQLICPVTFNNVKLNLASIY
jgi:hypothetical protein